MSAAPSRVRSRADGWKVTVAARHEQPVQEGRPLVTLDRNEEGALAVADGSISRRRDPVRGRTREQVLALDVGAIVAISSASVYADEQGRTLDEAQGVDDFPDFPLPDPGESHRAVPPGDATYSTKKVDVEAHPARERSHYRRPSSGRARSTATATGWRASGTSSSARSTSGRTSSGRARRETLPHDAVREHRRARAADRAGAAHGRLQLRRSGSTDLLELARAIGDAAGHAYTEVLAARPSRATWGRPHGRRRSR